VVSADELSRRKEEAEWQHFVRANGIDLRHDHALLALRPGAVVMVPAYTDRIWWFASDVNGIEMIVTACTVLFGTPIERTFPFPMVEVPDAFVMRHPHARQEADRYRRLLALRPGAGAEEAEQQRHAAA
jgi:hypothetical protein